MPDAPPAITRFAPSPTGFLHIGHAYAAHVAHETARGRGGVMALRIEDIDRGRCRPEFEEAIEEDLAWLGIRWAGPALRQSDRIPAHDGALAALRGRGVAYPCFCTRGDIRREIDRAGAAPHGPEGPLYPGTCRRLPEAGQEDRIRSGVPHAWRLDAGRARERTGALRWEDLRLGAQAVDHGLLGDPVLARRDGAPAYHLAATLDDHHQRVEVVTRGEDLAPSTHVHRTLQALLGLRTPRYFHHPLVRDRAGRRLAKHDGALAIRTLRERGASPADVLRMAEAGVRRPPA